MNDICENETTLGARGGKIPAKNKEKWYKAFPLLSVDSIIKYGSTNGYRERSNPD